MDEKIDTLLEKPYYVIDFLPERVPADANGQFFDVEYYLLNSVKYITLKDKFVNVILKLMCYYHVSVCWNGWIDRPQPEVIEQAINTIMENHSGIFHVLFPETDTLLTFEWDCLNLTVYNLSETMKSRLEKIAVSEGLFFWKAD